jgi:outer membrane protein OmpA-like peptidoglycan-associated protein
MKMNRMMRYWTLPLIVLVLAAGQSCNSRKDVKGAVIGAAAGGAAGAVIGNQTNMKNGTVIGAIMGATLGGTAGAIIGHHMDKQAEELRNDLKGADVERVGEGIKITFDSGLLFDVNKSDLTATSRANLSSLATTLNKYEDTEVLIEGHTDADGTDEYNRGLSRDRADNVRSYLSSLGVKAGRISAVGYGEEQPIADNATVDGKAKNRRVEVAIYANKKMKRAAERGELE